MMTCLCAERSAFTIRYVKIGFTHLFLSNLFEYSQTENMYEWQTGSLLLGLASASVKKSDSVGKEQAAKSVTTLHSEYQAGQNIQFDEG